MLIIIPVVLSLIALSSESFETSDLPIRMNVEHLIEQGSFRLEDSSFDNRPIMRLQGFEFLAMILEKVGSKGFSIIFFMSIFSFSILFVYLISLRTTQSPTAAWFSVILASTSSFILSSSLSYNEMLISLPLIMLFLYLFMQPSMNIVALIFVFVSLTLMNFSSIYLILILIAYFLVMNATAGSVRKEHYESVLVMIVIFFGILTAYSVAFQGNDTIPLLYNNLPAELLIQSFMPLALLGRIFSAGLIIILLAAAGSYYIISKANERALLPFSMLIAGALLSIISGDKIHIGIFAMGACIIASHGISQLLQYISISKASKYKRLLFALLALLIAFSGITQGLYSINSIRNDFASQDELSAYEHIREMPQEMIITPLGMAGRAEYYSGKNVFIKDDFTGVHNPNDYYARYKQLLETRSSVEALRILNDNGIGIMAFPADSIPFYLQQDTIERRCFNIYEFGSIMVYEVACGVRA